MSYAKEDLTQMLQEYSADPVPNPDRSREAAAQGRRMLRLRRARRAGAAATVASASVIAGVLITNGSDDGGVSPVPEIRQVSVRLPMDIQLPGAANGVVNRTLPLAESRYESQLGRKVTISFTPLSHNTMSNVRCADPRAWVLVRTDSPGMPTSVGRCGSGDHLAQFDADSAGDIWVGRPHTWQVWVLPADTKVTKDLDPNRIDKVAAEAGVEPGAWAVGIYDEKPR
ncbi:hypothetical protein BZB76_0485 [Actinomadura pelletieri DSM 43383]|uniref:Uncharacterized protein n=1 Tax=Actinomadura pelletieri DSM 43383 TaxID=1120940 RepID=A0A495QYN5_9ACTN|nr:hypothetical protein [Actinomadura pelletieri]RKS79046.1 hypothetical protein BZB76_0485 [Actinomadura pelletieri DSM 43383]